MFYQNEKNKDSSLLVLAQKSFGLVFLARLCACVPGFQISVSPRVSRQNYLRALHRGVRELLRGFPSSFQAEFIRSVIAMRFRNGREHFQSYLTAFSMLFVLMRYDP